MKDYSKFIFDLDYTLLIPDWSKEDDYFKNYIVLSQQEEFFKQKQDIINRYEIEFPKYDTKTLSEYFKSHGFLVTEELIRGWMTYNGETIKDVIADGVVDLFSHLKEKNKQIIILTCWFSVTQISRLKRTGLYDYVDKIVSGDDAMKPSIESFLLAVENTPKEECLMIGDSIRTDKVGAENAGIDSYIIDKDHTIRNLLETILNSEQNNMSHVRR